MLKNKPRILVTHQLQYLKAADQILVLKEVGASLSWSPEEQSCNRRAFPPSLIHCLPTREAEIS